MNDPLLRLECTQNSMLLVALSVLTEPGSVFLNRFKIVLYNELEDWTWRLEVMMLDLTFHNLFIRKWSIIYLYRPIALVRNEDSDPCVR